MRFTAVAAVQWLDTAGLGCETAGKTPGGAIILFIIYVLLSF